MYRDRTEAGRRLAEALSGAAGTPPLVLALPRGGVPVAAEVAARLQAPLDILPVRKIGAPAQPELAVGAVAAGDPPTVVLNPDIIRELGVDPGWIEAETADRAEAARRLGNELRGRHPPAPRRGRTVVLVDDGLATGATARAAVERLRADGAAEIVLAVPVAAAESLRELSRRVDRVVCPWVPDDFTSVGSHYESFEPVSDEEVARILAEARRAFHPSHSK